MSHVKIILMGPYKQTTINILSQTCQLPSSVGEIVHSYSANLQPVFQLIYSAFCSKGAFPAKPWSTKLVEPIMTYEKDTTHLGLFTSYDLAVNMILQLYRQHGDIYTKEEMLEVLAMDVAGYSIISLVING